MRDRAGASVNRRQTSIPGARRSTEQPAPGASRYPGTWLRAGGRPSFSIIKSESRAISAIDAPSARAYVATSHSSTSMSTEPWERTL